MFGQHLMQGSYTTQDGRSDVAISCCCKVSGDVQQCYTAKERRLLQHTSAQLHAGETMTLQKLVLQHQQKTGVNGGRNVVSR